MYFTSDESCASGRYEVKHPLGRAGKVAEVDLVHTTTAQELTEVAQSRLVKRSSDLLVPIGRCEQGQESRRSLQLTGKRDDRMHAAMDRNYHRANLMACDGVEIEMQVVFSVSFFFTSKMISFVSSEQTCWFLVVILPNLLH